MSPRIMALVAAALLASACPKPDTQSGTGEAPPKVEAAAVDREPAPVAEKKLDTLRWPTSTDAQWPAGCEIEDLGVHPHRPWITLACTNPDEIELGAVIVVDADAGNLVSVTELNDGGAGWYGDGPLVLWNAAGDRLCTNLATNGIGLLENGELIARNFPDDTADSPVDYAWVDHRIFTNRGNFFDPDNGAEMVRFEFDVVTDIEWKMDVFKWNARSGPWWGSHSGRERTGGKTTSSPTRPNETH